MMKKSVQSEDYWLALSILRSYRKEAGLRQDAFAELLGKPQPFVSKVERGVRRIDIVELDLIMTALGSSVEDFMARFRKARQARSESEPEPESAPE